jgi:hypothetical protein
MNFKKMQERILGMTGIQPWKLRKHDRISDPNGFPT